VSLIPPLLKKDLTTLRADALTGVLLYALFLFMLQVVGGVPPVVELLFAALILLVLARRLWEVEKSMLPQLLIVAGKWPEKLVLAKFMAWSLMVLGPFILLQWAVGSFSLSMVLGLLSLGVLSLTISVFVVSARGVLMAPLIGLPLMVPVFLWGASSSPQALLLLTAFALFQGVLMFIIPPNVLRGVYDYA